MPSPSGTTTRELAIVTGASGGIGLELARLFSRDGFELVLVARSEEKLAAAAAELKAAGASQVHTRAADLTRSGATGDLHAFIDTLGTPVYAIVNNAGFATWGPFAETPWPTTAEMIELNVAALTELTRLFLPGMLARGRGRVLNVASTAAFQPGPLMAVYYATKAYVLNFTEALAHELVGTGVTATALCPGPTETGFVVRADMQESKLFQTGRVMDAASVARIGYEAMQRGKPVVIAGGMNRLLAFVTRLVPRGWSADAVRKMQSRRTL